MLLRQGSRNMRKSQILRRIGLVELTIFDPWSTLMMIERLSLVEYSIVQHPAIEEERNDAPPMVCDFAALLCSCNS